MNITGAALEAEALRILRAIPGVTADVRTNAAADVLLSFAGTERPVVVEFRRQVNAAAAYQFIHAPSRDPQRPLVVIARAATREARALLADHGIGLIDGDGYAHLQLPGLLVHYEGARAPRPTASARLQGKAGVAAQALLLEPEREWRVADLAEIANISTGLAHRVLARLESENLVRAQGKGPKRTRTVTTPGALLDLWAEEDLPQGRATTFGYVLAQTQAQVVERIASGLAAAGIEYAVTGAAAAGRLASFVTSIPVIDVWVPEHVAVDQLLEAAGATAVEAGHNVSFLTTAADTGLAFARRDEDVVLANPMRIYGDLRRDPKRGAEQAVRLREEVLGI